MFASNLQCEKSKANIKIPDILRKNVQFRLKASCEFHFGKPWLWYCSKVEAIHSGGEDETCYIVPHCQGSLFPLLKMWYSWSFKHISSIWHIHSGEDTLWRFPFPLLNKMLYYTILYPSFGYISSIWHIHRGGDSKLWRFPLSHLDYLIFRFIFY